MLNWGLIGHDDQFINMCDKSDDASLLVSGDTLIINKDVDIYYIAHTHSYKECVQLLNEGFCVLALSPVTSNIKEINHLEKLVNDNVLTFLEVSETIFHPIIQHIQKEIELEAIGKVEKIEYTYTPDTYHQCLLLHVLFDYPSQKKRSTTNKMTIIGTKGKMMIEDYMHPDKVHVFIDNESYTAEKTVNIFDTYKKEIYHCISYLQPTSSYWGFEQMRRVVSYPYVVGITGSIATGKSTVSHYLKEKGYMIIDADELSHQALEDEIIQTRIKDAFHIDEVSRPILGELVFHDASKKKVLEDILHPYIYDKTKESINKHHGILFIDVPLLFEAGFDTLCDRIVCVSCKKDIQIQRLMHRNHLTEFEAINRINQQMSVEEKEKLSDDIIDNNDDILKTYGQIDKILERIEKNV